MSPRIVTVITIFLAVMSGVLLTVHFYSKQQDEAFLKTAHTATGTVLSLEQTTQTQTFGSGASRHSVSTLVYSPIVSFTDFNGKTVTFTSGAASNPPAYAVGQTVAVLYDPAQPLNAQLQGDVGGFSTAVFWIGIVFLVFAFVAGAIRTTMVG